MVRGDAWHDVGKLFQCAGCETRFKYREEMVSHQAQCQQVSQLRFDSLLSSGFIRKPFWSYHFVRSVEKEDVPEDLLNKKHLPRRRKTNQCIQCDRYFLTQVQSLDICPISKSGLSLISSQRGPLTPTWTHCRKCKYLISKLLIFTNAQFII